MGDLAAAYPQLRAEGIGVAAISVDSVEDSRALADKLHVEFPLLSDPQAEVIGAYGVREKGEPRSLPATFVVRPDRVVAWEHVGEAPMDRPELSRVRAEAAALHTQ